MGRIYAQRPAAEPGSHGAGPSRERCDKLGAEQPRATCRRGSGRNAMDLGFASAILPDLSLEEVLAFAADEGFDCVEVMCWPTDATDQRRYAGVTHIDVAKLDERGAQEVHARVERYGVGISALGYYPNPLAPDRVESDTYVQHIGRVIDAASLLGVEVVNTFIGRDPSLPIESQWDRVEEVWRPLVER